MKKFTKNQINKLIKLSTIKKISNCDNSFYTPIIPKFRIEEYPIIDWGNNGVGQRWCNNLFCYVSIYKNKEFCEYPINLDDSQKLDDNQKIELKNEIDLFFTENKKDISNRKAKSIVGIKIYGFHSENTKRTIRKDIKKKVITKPCIVCGSSSNIVCDHKNDMYNDERVLSTETQIIHDFQPLCQHCNLQKRQINKKTRELKKLSPATDIPMLKPFGIEFINNIEKIYDETDTNLVENCFWTDPVKFMEYIHNSFMDQINEWKDKYETCEKENKKLLEENKKLKQ